MLRAGLNSLWVNLWHKSSLLAGNLTTYSHTLGALYARLGSRKPGHSVPVRALNPQRASRSHALMLTVALSIPVLHVELVWAEWWGMLVWSSCGPNVGD